MERKSFELYVHTAAWTGGIAAAATGGVLLALVNHDTPASLIFWLRFIGVALLIALAAAAYMQFHAIAVLNAYERSNTTEAEASAKHVGVSQYFMFGGLAIAAILLGIGLNRFQVDPKPPDRWTVAGIGNAGDDSIVAMSRPDSSTVRILTRKAGDDGWRVSEVSGAEMAATAPAADTPASAGLVGTWRLMSFEDVENGQTVRRFGDKPLGLFVYTADGHVTIQIANPANPVCVAPGKKFGPGKKDDLAVPVCSPKQMRALLDGSVAYWGTYTVDAAAGVVIHHVKSDISNGYIGTDQRRPFQLKGDRLVIGDGNTWTRVLERVR